MPPQKPLTKHQQELINVVKSAHDTLLVARRVKSQEVERRLAEARIQAERDWDEIEARIRHDVIAEIAVHESNEDEALIAAYEAGVPVRNIALQGFGNRLDGAVHQKLRDLRADGRVGNVEGYQPRLTDGDRVVSFPKPVDVETILAEKTTISPPVFTLDGPLVLVPADTSGLNEIAVPSVKITMDERDPYFKQIEGNMRKGTQWKGATHATLYLHPATGALIAHESKEPGDILWDHPVARWVKDHESEARAGVEAALATLNA